MQLKTDYKFFSIFLCFFSFFSFFLGFYFEENSAGAGGYNGDFLLIWKNLQIFINNDLLVALNHPEYYDSRAPTSYILHKFLNPWVDSEISFRASVFIISLSLPFLFYFCLKNKFKEENNLLLLLVSSVIFLSPYFRTTAYWGLQENYSLIFLLLSFLSLNIFLNEKINIYKKYFYVFLIIFFSSSCLYFDLKLAIIPIICFLKIISSKNDIKIKLFSIIAYFLFSLPYIFMLLQWGTLIPPAAAEVTQLGGFFIEHIGYSSTMIAFYLLPLLLLKEKSLYNLIKSFFADKRSYYLISFIIFYIIYLSIFYQFNEETLMGNGFIHKTAIILFKNNILREIFVYFSFFISWIIILIFIDKNFNDFLILLYFFIISLIKWPIMQEYFDPLIVLMAFTFFSSKLFINYKNIKILFFYLSIFLVICNFYYLNIPTYKDLIIFYTP